MAGKLVLKETRNIASLQTHEERFSRPCWCCHHRCSEDSDKKQSVFPPLIFYSRFFSFGYPSYLTISL